MRVGIASNKKAGTSSPNERAAKYAGDLDLAHYLELAHAVSPDMPVIIKHLNTFDEYLESLRHVQELIRRSGLDLGFRR